MSELHGMVMRSTGSRNWVLSDDGVLVECVVRGKFRIAGLNTTNPVTVGDFVFFTKKEEEEIGIITKIEERRNFILRKAIAHSRKVHILAANIDQAVFIYTLKQPPCYTRLSNSTRHLEFPHSYIEQFHLLTKHTRASMQ